ncbi:bifunctional UDP-N-acetylglucosamine diphosphorylase/glucosamine-1-phosphate N-acetyltransferase GlmU [Sansalvadorimonas sp. 2012CJ34-2]|uniref:Bifunctional protein GlmU n=1 Tax=Parendozoicomonas callyspongiae TaxID=2942213 RepID=A0ABT0PB29_9GAMM|nr:bifunctional UDP-N-acetylglucosamine diphosphorylase/glucosamine-1-phosphate N-acetyltransferase GlmU [Sansalvadorimonas sp. 2012CJ34-2]MCL6268590.1 bifunctional UDP-N-acetylglucosamine diphosphorylase/glucosamine-1-phosphate N-acetyltransferase GlmU [Sansalvadorimonas sp. 2012CJ34-2]
MKTEVIILAAGQGSRMKSSLPKVLHPIAGRSMLEHVIGSAEQTLDGQEDIHVVIGHGADTVRERLAHFPVNWVEQTEQLGTGHAVMQAAPACSQADVVLVLYGDVPMILPSTLQSLVSACDGKNLALLTIDLANPSGYGRIVRDTMGAIQAIVEDKDATPEQKAITETNTGIMAIPGKRMAEWLNNLNNNNAQGEFYLTDIVAMAVEEGTSVVNARPSSEMEVQGVNNRMQQAQLERLLQKRQAEQLMNDGVTILDPARLDIRGSLACGNDVVIDINCIFEGEVKLEDNVQIGPNCHIQNAVIKAGSIIKANSVIEDAVVGEDCDVGPFARLRPGTRLETKAKVGNFVETKKAHIGEGSKVNHLSYVGDAEVGEGVNVGAGTITCNYDGANKFKTTIADGAFIGSNTALVAPVTVGKDAVVGAGSTVNDDVPDGHLGIARGKQRNIPGWKKPAKK